jgi:hypothetical protein
MKTFIILIPLFTNRNARAEAELIEASNLVIGGAVQATDVDVHKSVSILIGHKDFEVESLTNYMDLMNNQDIDSDTYFISYVFA